MEEAVVEQPPSGTMSPVVVVSVVVVIVPNEINLIKLLSDIIPRPPVAAAVAAIGPY